MSDCKVFFTKLPQGTPIDELRSHFESVGTVIDVFFGKENKFGFVTYSDAKSAKRAVTHLCNKAPYYLVVEFPKKTEKSYSNWGNNRDDRSEDSNSQSGHSNFNTNRRNQNAFGGSMNANLASSGADGGTDDFKITEVINYLVKVKEPNFLQHLNMAAREYVQKNLPSISPIIDSYNTIESNAAKLFKPDVTANGDANNFDFKFTEPKYNEPKSFNNNPGGPRKPGTRSDFSDNISFSNGDTDREEKNKWPELFTTKSTGASNGQQRPKPLVNNYNTNDDYISQFMKPKPKPDDPKPIRDAAMDNDTWDDQLETRNESPKSQKVQESFENGVKGQKQVESFRETRLVIEPKPVTPLKNEVRIVKSIETRLLPSNEFSKVVATFVESENTGYVVLADKLPEIMKMHAEFQKLAVTSHFVPELNKICIGFINRERVRVQITEMSHEIFAKCIDSGVTISANSDNFIDIEDETIFNRPAEAIRIELDNNFTLQEDLCFEVKPLFIKKSKTVMVLARNENDTNNFDEFTVKIPEGNIPKLPATCEPTKVAAAANVIEKKHVSFDSSLPELLIPSPLCVRESKIKSFIYKDTLAAGGFVELYYAYSENQVVGSCVVDEYCQYLDEIERVSNQNVDPDYSPNVGDYCFGLRPSGVEWARGLVLEKHANNDYVMALIDYGLKETISCVRPMTEPMFQIPNFATLVQTSDPDKFVHTTFCFKVETKHEDELYATFINDSGEELADVMVLKPFYADLSF